MLHLSLHGGSPTNPQQIYMLHTHYTTKHIMFKQHASIQTSNLHDLRLFTPKCDEGTFLSRIVVGIIVVLAK